MVTVHVCDINGETLHTFLLADPYQKTTTYRRMIEGTYNASGDGVAFYRITADSGYTLDKIYTVGHR